MSLDPAVREALEEILRDEPQSAEVKKQVQQLVTNWFAQNSTDDDVARVVRRVHVHLEQED